MRKRPISIVKSAASTTLAKSRFDFIVAPLLDPAYTTGEDWSSRSYHHRRLAAMTRVWQRMFRSSFQRIYS
ncbi:hypothetical protein OAO39_00710 [Pirellulaceae bacterium]|nr:hypothetical protein [Pirellulaceae bacterium]